MRKKKLVKRVAGIALTVGAVILAIVCVGKVNRIQNEKDIIGTWKDANAEEIFTFQENGELAVSKDMPIRVYPAVTHIIVFLTRI